MIYIYPLSIIQPDIFMWKESREYSILLLELKFRLNINSV